MPAREQDWGAYAVVPPPPSAPTARPSGVAAVPQRQGDPELGAGGPPSRPAGHPFDAELDATELDERDRPGPTWAARGRRLSRSNIIIRTRRMCYAGRRVLLAVHLIDSQPAPLFGVVRTCEYEEDGMYLLSIDLLPVPDRHGVGEWLREQGR